MYLREVDWDVIGVSLRLQFPWKLEHWVPVVLIRIGSCFSDRNCPQLLYLGVYLLRKPELYLILSILVKGIYGHSQHGVLLASSGW